MQMLMRALSSPPFANYRVWWSLSDSKYAGTALFMKKCLQPKKVFFNLDRIGIFSSDVLGHLIFFSFIDALFCSFIDVLMHSVS